MHFFVILLVIFVMLCYFKNIDSKLFDFFLQGFVEKALENILFYFSCFFPPWLEENGMKKHMDAVCVVLAKTCEEEVNSPLKVVLKSQITKNDIMCLALKY